MHGNRDFLVGKQFIESINGSLLEDETVIDLYGTHTLLMHGDSLCTKDTEYMAFRHQVRQSSWQQAMLSKPLMERKAIAAHLRNTSQSMNSLKADDIMDVTPEEVIKSMAAHQVTQLIHGHTHRPARHALTINQQTAERLVLGDWHHTGWYIQADCDGKLTLHQFDITN